MANPRPKNQPTRARAFLILTLGCALFGLGLGSKLARANPPGGAVNLMGPLLIGDPNDLAGSRAHWDEFSAHLRRARELGVHAISTDIWWGLVEPEAGSYRWEYYEEVAKRIREAGLKWVPILSFHQLGGNVGDTGSMPLPKHVWETPLTYEKVVAGGKIERVTVRGDAASSPLMYLSEQGNRSKEVVSVWGTDAVMAKYKSFMTSFRDRFSKDADLITEINISLGASGELRYPSYNMHDVDAGFPTRGSLQAYSEPAVESFRAHVRRTFWPPGVSEADGLRALNEKWKFNLASFDEVLPPNALEMTDFFARNDHFSAYGQFFFDWYNQSLVDHGTKMLDAATSIFAHAGSALRGAELGGKLCGVHWRAFGDRLAELTAGLVRTSYPDWRKFSAGFGYRHTLSVFKPRPAAKIVMHYTAIEMADMIYENGRYIGSAANTLTHQLGLVAARMQIVLKGENALSGTLGDHEAWKRMSDVLLRKYRGVTLLRMGDIIGQPVREKLLRAMIRTLRPGADVRKELCKFLVLTGN